MKRVVQTPPDTPEAENKAALTSLSVVIFLMSFGFYILYPLLANQLISWRKISVVVVTLVLNARIITQDLLMLPSDFLLRRLGGHLTVAVGGITRGIGFALFTLTDNIALLVLASILTGIGGALFFPATHMLYTQLTNSENRMTIFAKRERLNSLGAVLGPLAGTALLQLGFIWVGFAAAFVFIGSSIFLAIAAPRGETLAARQKPEPFRLRTLLDQGAFLWFIVAAMLLMQISNQVSIATAVRINQIDPDYGYVGLISSLSSVVIVVLQVSLLRAVGKRLTLAQTLMVSTGFFMAGFVVIGFMGGILSLYIGAVLCCFGTILHMPTRDAMLSLYAGSSSSGAFYGVQGIANTFGNLLLASGLGVLYDMSAEPRYYALPWLAILAAGALCIGILAKLPPPAPKE